ncbi:hypothetical protein NE235_12945 [Actinoallomurus spadix]|uniref:hypothetical protein n=1 Tax=Actinoallomurus spadix TaxID=79912 RepID=UPI002091EEE3|nr:hypothetical protein [Actinoallomurus spadix]MCO5987007.1 hypothetical protein [Actinoallomurus spadix]
MALAIVGVLLAFLIVPPILDRTFFTPKAAIRGFFDALARRDAPAALHALPKGVGEDEPLLTSAVLRSRDYVPPRHVRILRQTQEDDHRLVEVGFQIGAKRETGTVRLEREDGAFFTHWRVNGLQEVRGAATGATELTVNGVRLRTDSAEAQPRAFSTFALPGGYTVRLPDNPVLGASPEQVHAAGTGNEVTLQPTVKASAVGEADNQVRSYLDQCAQSTELSPTGCPFSVLVFGTPSTLRWKIDKYPQITVQMSQDGPYLTTVAEGSATAAGTAKDFSSTEKFSKSDSFSVEGPVEVAGNGVKWTPR